MYSENPEGTQGSINMGCDIYLTEPGLELATCNLLLQPAPSEASVPSKSKALQSVH